MVETFTLGENFTKRIVLCLGFFDCMHKGHLELLSHARKLAQNDAQVALFTFSNNHFETLKRPTMPIFTFDERQHIYESSGVEVLVTAHFDRDFMKMTGEQFLQRICRYNVAAVVCGSDYTCGCDRISAQQVAGALQHKAPVHIVPLVHIQGQKVSSSLVRELLVQHNIQQANSLLSQPFFFLGEVKHGRNVGHDLGFPTVNLDVPQGKLAPQGVYGGQVFVDGKVYRALVNVGPKPTFDCGDSTVEAHLLNFDGNLYGRQIKVSLLKFLRPIQKFSSPQQLKQQILRDLSEVEND